MDRRQLDELSALVGERNVRNDRTTLKKYFGEVPEGADLAVVVPEDQGALGLAASYAYEQDIPMYTHRRGKPSPEVAVSGGILFDLTGIDEIVRIDEPNLLAFVQYGVSFERLKEELDGKGLRVLMPVSATSPSVVRSMVDRDIFLANGATRPYQLTIFHAILADGRVWMSGNDQMCPDGHSEFREDIGPMYSYFFHASEDIFGMPYAVKAYVYRRWEDRRVRAYGFRDAESALRTAHLACRNDQVFECVVADARFLGVLLGSSADEAEGLADELAPWNVVFGFDNHPKLTTIWDRQTAGIAVDNGGEPAAGGLAERMEERFELPWYISDRDYYRGSTETIDYYCFTGKAPAMFQEAQSALDGYDTGRVAVPMYYGGAFYCETDIYCPAGDERLTGAWLEAYRKVLDLGAHVNRPRGEVARIIYDRLDPENIRMIKNLKSVLDPKGLLNRGQLMEGV